MIKSSGLTTVCIRLILAALVLFWSPIQALGQESGDFVILAMGDSLMAGYNLAPGESVPDRLQAALRDEGLDVTIVNAGVSGDTSSAGLSRLDWALSGIPGGPPDLVILEFGGNDTLRGIEPGLTRGNIARMIEYLQRKEIPILLAGMQAPVNMGRDYKQEFDSLYPELAERYGVAFYPFFLEGVATIPELNLPDGIHPNPEGVSVIVGRLAPVVQKLLTD